MDKIVIIGSPGSGKSTLARDLGSMYHIHVVHLDRIFWQQDWKEKPRDNRIDILQEIVREKQWIIEGTYLGSSEPRLDATDTIIFLDIPAYICLLHIIKRHLGYRGRTRRDIPEGSKDKLTLFRIFKVLVFPIQDRRALNKKLINYKSKEIIWLHSSKEVEDFLAQLDPQANEMKQSSKKPVTAGEGRLVTA